MKHNLYSKIIPQVFIQTLFILCFFASFGLLMPTSVAAQSEACPSGYTCQGGCTATNQCSGGKLCAVIGYNYQTSTSTIGPSGTTCGGGEGKAVLGGVQMPGISKYRPMGQNTTESIGIVLFASRLLRIFTIVCGMWFMFNMIYAGYLFITSSGEAAVFNKFKESLLYSLIGLIIIATAYLIAGLIGAVFFGDPGFIIRPTLYQATAP